MLVNARFFPFGLLTRCDWNVLCLRARSLRTLCFCALRADPLLLPARPRQVMDDFPSESVYQEMRTRSECDAFATRVARLCPACVRHFDSGPCVDQTRCVSEACVPPNWGQEVITGCDGNHLSS